MPVAESRCLVQLSFISKSILRADEKLADRVASLMLNVYNDTKKLTLSSYSLPSHAVVSQMANSVSLLQASNRLDELDLQYLTLNGHHEFLSCIVESSRESVAKILLDEMQFHCDVTAASIAHKLTSCT